MAVICREKPQCLIALVGVNLRPSSKVVKLRAAIILGA